MPFGYECRARIVKQVPINPTVRTGPISQEQGTPGPAHYESPEVCGGKGYSLIKRAPAYTFGRVLKPCGHPAVSPNAPLFNCSQFTEKGGYKIPGGLIAPNIELPSDKTKIPGPGTHSPQHRAKLKRAPAYTMRPAAKPTYQSFDSWTPPPNMYCPPIPKPRAPAYFFSDKNEITTKAKMPGPGEHDPNYKLVQKTKPAFSFGPRYKEYRETENTPAPNTYCEKKYMVNKPTTPAPSFGIRHSPYVGSFPINVKPPDLEKRISYV